MSAWKAAGFTSREHKRKLASLCLGVRRHHLYIRAIRAGTNFQTAAHLPDPFAHAPDADSDRDWLKPPLFK